MKDDEILKYYGIKVEGSDKYGIYEFWGTTPKKNKFYMFMCKSLDKYTVKVNNKVLATKCNFRTAIRLILSK